MKVVFDSSVIIGVLEPSDLLHQKALALMVETAGSEWLIASLTRSEVLSGYAKVDIGMGVSALEKLNLKTAPALAGDIDNTVEARSNEWADLVATIRAGYRLKTPDAVVLATAILVGGVVGTLDEKLGAAARKAGYAWNGHGQIDRR
ncbi:MAG: type II toxin-antitoxin system VapC family toxin [Promicromonosporaceae bacterium]|nr:type II toxin-antitoxin system VapC family toxin [Promicromonosporaceae bacterium]